MFINWNYTNACNFQCVHCYSRAPEYEDELSSQSYLAIAERLIEYQVFRVGFGGGEPLVRKDFIEILTKLGQSGVRTDFTTNGWFVDSFLAQKIGDARVGRVSVSIDSPEEAEHESIRNRLGSFEKAKQACRLLIGAGIETWISATITSLTASKVPEYAALARGLNVSGINFKMFRPAGNGLIFKERLALRQGEREIAIDDIKSIEPEANFKVTMYGPESKEDCSCGRTTLTIRPNGDVVVCPYGNNCVGNILIDPLGKIWERVGRRVDSCTATEDSNWPLGRREMSKDTVSRHLLKLTNSSLARKV